MNCNAEQCEEEIYRYTCGQYGYQNINLHTLVDERKHRRSTLHNANEATAIGISHLNNQLCAWKDA
jgi:hypothetical protein